MIINTRLWFLLPLLVFLLFLVHCATNYPFVHHRCISMYKKKQKKSPPFVLLLSRSRTEINITKKRISEAFHQLYHLSDLAATSTVAIVQNRVGWVG